ncbi:FYVE zinc finger-domain-containing protein [Hygrophoropsis aurantiaca]|uniref:FYVE zinc finger-domain-containing protein n=1 Tax=Hygrophoropsis aurantiaca TaxID=72124 RepID=A0ACB8A509_9AGAM|nr:FYVE zinc finger-domain-containing protein [Hygrophoropsis aurantiaca]
MDSPPHVPYQAYRSKRHSRTVSSLPLAPNVSPPPLSRPASVVSNVSIPIPNGPTFASHQEYYDTEKLASEFTNVVSLVTENAPRIKPTVDVNPVRDLPTPLMTNGSTPESSPPEVSPTSTKVASPPPTHEPLQDTPPAPSLPNGNANGKNKAVDLEPPAASASQSSSQSTGKSRKTTTFRRIPATRSPLPSSPLRPPGTLPKTQTQKPAQSQPPIQSQPSPHSRTSSASSSIRQFDVPRPPPVHHRVTSLTSVHSTIDEDKPFVAPAPIHPPPRGSSMLAPPPPPPKTSSPAMTSAQSSLAPSPVSQNLSPSPSPSTSRAASTSGNTFTPTPPPSTRSAAPYRPGFQPRGLYRPRTDDFFAARRAKVDEGRVERTKLERRFEKLINLHFPEEGREETKRPVEQRRSSSIFELDFRNLSSLDAGELWKGVVQSQALQGAKGDLRAAEQRITPWQEDGAVPKCPLCTASFHPLTNRKHHCRLCGKIMCSLPIKHPQRPQPCSILFVVDAKTRRIEEVGEGVDYGVRKRRGSVDSRKGKEKGKDEEEEEKFLKGVRICRDCQPILAREQYYQEVAHAPPFIRFYEAFIDVEKEIEDSLPQFQELLLTLSNDDQPTKEASAARKRLLDAFAQYDALAKRICKIPCAKGGSQDRVQNAILTRANLFLQKHMFPLQSLPKPKKHNKSSSSSSPSPSAGPAQIDPDSALAHALQPLLEQEALLESFVEEAMTRRKFEDAKTLKTNLGEIRGEIERVMGNVGGMGGR